MRPSWRSCTGLTAPLRARCRVSARNRIEVSGERRSCATSTTSSRPSGPDSRSAKCCDQSASSRWPTCSMAPSSRSSWPASGAGSAAARSTNAARISPSSRRESAFRGSAARSALCPLACWRMAVHSWARCSVTSSIPAACSTARSHSAWAQSTASRSASQSAGATAAARRPVGIPDPHGPRAPGDGRRRSPLVVPGSGGLGNHSGDPGASSRWKACLSISR